jgi:hypothetical protein
MSLLSQNTKGKKGAKNAKAAAGGKQVIKPGKIANVTKKTIKTGGTRGS